MRFTILLTIFILTASLANAHSFTTMVGFYDGLTHPVLGFDHFFDRFDHFGPRAVFLRF